MTKIAFVLIGLIAALHVFIAWFEIFAWVDQGPHIFKSLPAELFPPTKAMAANQGLYNGFLAAGLIWSLFIGDWTWKRNVATCFLLFVAVAGIFGAMTVSPRIMIVQTVPAILALIALHMGRRS